MKLTNNLNLPQPLVEAVANDEYDRGAAHISITGLLRPPRLSALEEAHAEEITEDAADRIWSLVGQVVHGVLERADKTGIAERRLWMQVEGWTVSGQMDRYQDGLLQDYKFVTAWKFKAAGVPEEYEQQLNLYAALLRHHGHPVQRMEIVGILRDFSKLEARRDPEYPQQQVVVRQVPLWAPERAAKFLRERVILHQQARVRLPECSASERWAKPDVYAVMKQGKDRAVRLYETEIDAITHAKRDSSLYVDKRPGANIRCEAYCPVSGFCSQFQALKTKKEVTVAEEVG